MEGFSEKYNTSSKLSIEDRVEEKFKSYNAESVITKTFHQHLTHTKEREFFEGQTDIASKEIIQRFLWRFNRMKRRFCAYQFENYC